MSPTYSICRNDGYIAGEVWKCPKCGAETEVYSRITGYYRPVKNWNAGKAQEFRDRETYKIMDSSPRHDLKKSVKEEAVMTEDADNDEATALLFTTKTCPNCVMIKNMLNKNGFHYEVIDAEEHADLVRQYGIMQAPTLVMVGKNHAESYSNASNIIRFVNSTGMHS